MDAYTIVDSDFLTKICDKKQEEAQKKAIMRVAAAASVIHVHPQRMKHVSSSKAATQAAATQEVTSPSRRPSTSRIGDHCGKQQGDCLEMHDLGNLLDTSLRDSKKRQRG